MFRTSFLSFSSSLLLVSAFGAIACSGAPTFDPDGDGGLGSAPPSSAPRDTGAGSDTNRGVDSGSPPSGDAAPPPDSAADTAIVVDAPAADVAPPLCAAATGVYAATPSPHDVLFLLDRSGSMHIKVGSGATRWQAAEKGLDALLSVLATDGAIHAGLDMFPRGDAPITCCWIDPSINDVACDCAAGELPGPAARCGADAYSPALVPVGALDDVKKLAISAATHRSDTEFYWGTPMKAALSAAIAKQQASTHVALHSVVLITDGAPTSCNATDDRIDAVIAAAQAGATASAPVPTYVVGVIDGVSGANAEHLSKVAVAGGTARTFGCEATNSCFYAVNAATFETDLAKAFHAIELEAFSCTFDVPTVASGTPDYALMNVTLTTGAGATSTVARDATHANGWDLVAGASKIQLYGAACTSVKDDAGAKVDVVVGCKTVGK